MSGLRAVQCEAAVHLHFAHDCIRHVTSLDRFLTAHRARLTGNIDGADKLRMLSRDGNAWSRAKHIHAEGRGALPAVRLRVTTRVNPVFASARAADVHATVTSQRARPRRQA